MAYERLRPIAALRASATCCWATPICRRTCSSSACVWLRLLLIGVFQALELGRGLLVLGELRPQPPRVVFEMAQFEAGVGQLRGGLLARSLQLLRCAIARLPAASALRRRSLAACSAALAAAAASA